MCCSRDAEANDMIHMGSDHRSVKKKISTAESTKSQDEKTRSGGANMFEERYAELERKIKHEAETAATAQKPKMTLLEQAEGGVVAEIEAAHQLNDDANAAVAVLAQADGIADAAAARHSNEDANAAAAHNRDANTAAHPESEK